MDHLHDLITILNGKIGKYTVIYLFVSNIEFCHFSVCKVYSLIIHNKKMHYTVPSMKRNLAVVSSLWMKSTNLSIPYEKIVIHGSCFWNRIDLMYICMILRRSYFLNNHTYLVFREMQLMMCVFISFDQNICVSGYRMYPTTVVTKSKIV